MTHALFAPLLALALLSTPAVAEKRPIFSLKVLEAIARGVAGRAQDRGAKAMLDEVNSRVHDAYPELIVPAGEGEWIFNSVGGSLAEIKVLFCSPTEYMALWGSPLATEGFSGRYAKMDVWDIMLSGTMRSYAPGGEHRFDTYVNSGPEGTHQTSWLKREVGKHFQMDPGSYMIDYGRGNLLGSLKTGAILGHKYVTGDSYSRKRMLSTCAHQTFDNWLTPARRKAIRRYRATNPDLEG